MDRTELVEKYQKLIKKDQEAPAKIERITDKLFQLKREKTEAEKNLKRINSNIRLYEKQINSLR